MALQSFLAWFYVGLGGIGGWLIFLLLALAAIIWVLYDSSTRHIPALGWKLGIILSALLIVPAVVYRLTEMTALAPYTRHMFYLGLLGSVLAVVLAVGYYVAFQGMIGCPNGHVYEAVLGSCPYDAAGNIPTYGLVGDQDSGTYSAEDIGGSFPSGGGHSSATGMKGGAEMEPPKPKAPAWLVTPDGREHQLNQGVTVIGRSPRSDIVLDESTVGREHAKIIEEKGTFRLHDLGSANHTYVNDQRVEKPVLLEGDDRISFGRKAVVKFVYTRR